MARTEGLAFGRSNLTQDLCALTTFSIVGIYPYYSRYNFGLRGAVEVVSPTLIAQLSPQATTVISITTTGFTPPTVTVSLGDTVRWVNTDTTSHAIQGGVPYEVCLPLVMRP